MESGFCHFSFPSDCVSSGAFQGSARWALGLCLLTKAFVLGAFWPLLGVSGLLMSIGLTSLHQLESQGSVAVMFSDWCPHRGSRTVPGDLTCTSEASQRARPNGRSSLGIQPRDTSEAFCGHGPLTPCTDSSVQVGGKTGWSEFQSPPCPNLM